MSLNKCRTCGSLISKNAKTCPKCGERKPHNISSGRLLMVGILVAGGMMYLAPDDPKKDYEPTTKTTYGPRVEGIRYSGNRSINAVNDVVEERIVLNSEQELFLCRATIAAVMYKPISIIEKSSEHEQPTVKYKRPDDGNIYHYSCKFDGDIVIWRALFDDGWGRWRDLREDGVIRFQMEEGAVVIREYLDGYELNNKRFTND